MDDSQEKPTENTSQPQAETPQDVKPQTSEPAKPKKTRGKSQASAQVSQNPADSSQALEDSPEVQVSVEPKAVAAPKKRVTKKKVEVKQEAGMLPDYRKNIKLFKRWPIEGVVVNDPSLKSYINLSSVYVPYTAGRNIAKQFWKSKKSIIERLATKLMTPGHKGKKHYWTSGPNTGKVATHYKILIKTFGAIESKTKQNPIQVLVRALEEGTPREGVAHIEYGGVRYPKAADMSPQKRVDMALRWMVQGAFVKSVKGKAHMWNSLADEIIAASQADVKSNCITKRTELERQAAASR